MTTPQLFGDIPFRIRVGKLGNAPVADNGPVRDEILKLFDARSQQLLANAKHTELKLQFDSVTLESLRTFDVLLIDGNSPAAEPVLELAREERRPIISITKSNPLELSVEQGGGLNAEVVRALERFNELPISEGVRQTDIGEFYNSNFSATDGIPSYAKYIIRSKLLPYYVRADTLAKLNQKTYQQAGKWVYIFSAVAVASVALGVWIPALSLWSYVLEFVLLATIVFMILSADRKHVHINWIQTRYLAERLRAAVFLTTCGVQPSSVGMAGSVGVTARPDQWITTAYSEIVSRLPFLQRCHGQESKKFVAFASRFWLDDQITFHETKAIKSNRYNKALERAGIIVFSLAVLAALFHLLLHPLHLDRLDKVLTFFAISLPAAGAAIGGIRTHREYSRLAMRSRNMAERLNSLKKQLSRVSTPDELQSVLWQVEELSLLEVQDWLMLMSVVKLEAA